ncbi:MarR family winged helix-turn-helix transcriptional regulator [Conexibacter sp. CPCC 206217]|uniref:MarR family winged helix-turn-helix transcriptional regulator n=1 Tax=Conexibacter sp. CPCC 206217 TaxID=3064574 RepID=UPI002716E9CD|nr:MarR family transcriptional regulator [Conexibacter sp. CPCC 206217]MDO8210897.1 MarR family transcriptional regulator [Conexibacter sp. CPCC 206217]
MAIHLSPISPLPAPADVGLDEHGGSTCGADDWARLSEHETNAWHGFLQAHAEIQVELEHELQTAHQLSFSDYFALLALEKAPGGQLRMHDLAKPVRLTRSGLTRLVERLERIGLIERRPCEDDARGTEARITDAGRLLVHAASATHLAGVRRRFLERFSPAELQVLAEQFGRLAG